MKNQPLTESIQQEILTFISSRNSLNLATLTESGSPYASLTPFAIGENCLYILISEIAMHAKNLQHNPLASVLIAEDENSASELFARLRINYQVRAELISADDDRWRGFIEHMATRLAKRIYQLSELADFKLFRLIPVEGRYIKGFGQAYAFQGESLNGAPL